MAETRRPKKTARILDRVVTYKMRGKTRRAPLVQAVAELEDADLEGACQRLYRSLSPDDRFQLYTEALADPRCGVGEVYDNDLGFLDVSKRCGPPAAALANRLVKRGARVANDVRWPVFVALVRAGVPIKPAWDALLPVPHHGIDRQKCVALVPVTATCIRVIPEARREAAVVGAINNEVVHAVENVRALWPILPCRALVACGIKGAKATPGWTPTELLSVLRKDHPSLAPLLDRNAKKRSAAVALRRAAKPTPITRLAQLTPRQRAQLVICGQRYDGAKLPAAARLASDRDSESSFLGSLAFVQLVDDRGKAAYDVFIYRGDSGSIFVAGTSRVAASIIQNGIECGNAALGEGIAMALGM